MAIYQPELPLRPGTLPLLDGLNMPGCIRDAAREIIDNLTAAIEQHWDHICEDAELTEVEKKFLWRRQFLNPYSVEY